MAAPRHTFNGRTFRELKKSTIEHDLWVGGHVNATGLNTVERLPGEEAGDFGVRVTNAVLYSGRALLLLGGLLIPDEREDLDWTPELGAETAKHLAGISDEQEKTKVHVLLGKLVLGFFVDGVLSAAISRNSSASPMSRLAINGTSET